MLRPSRSPTVLLRIYPRSIGEKLSPGHATMIGVVQIGDPPRHTSLPRSGKASIGLRLPPPANGMPSDPMSRISYDERPAHDRTRLCVPTPAPSIGSHLELSPSCPSWSPRGVGPSRGVATEPVRSRRRRFAVTLVGKSPGFVRTAPQHRCKFAPRAENDHGDMSPSHPTPGPRSRAAFRSGGIAKRL